MWKDEIKKKEPNRFSASDYDYLSDIIPANIKNQMMQDITKLLEKYDDKLKEANKNLPFYREGRRSGSNPRSGAYLNISRFDEEGIYGFKEKEMNLEEFTFRALVAVILAYEDRIGHSRNLMGAGRFFNE